jgi:rare lipoprotein A
VRINDRGPYVADRVIDLSQRSARELGLECGGTGRVRVKYAGRAPLDGNDRHERQFLASRPWSGEAQRVADAGTDYPRAAPSRSYAPLAQPSYTAEPQPPPLARTSAPRAWAMNDTTAAAPRSYGATQGWSPAAYRAGLAAR